MKTLISPRDLADAIGVSESSIKRWVDNEVIQATKTAGGHRRIALGEAVRFLREKKVVLINPGAIGLHASESNIDLNTTSESDTAEALYRYLLDGQTKAVVGLIVSMYLNGQTVAQIVDSSVVQAMDRLGELWRDEECGVFWEHRATDIAIYAVSRLRMMIPARRNDSPVAVGAAPSGDPYILPSLCAAAVIESQGVEAVNLGADTPIDSLQLAIGALQARLVWLSISVVSNQGRLQEEITNLGSSLREPAIPIIVGGSQAGKINFPDTAFTHVGSSMGELEAMVKGLQLAAANA